MALARRKSLSLKRKIEIINEVEQHPTKQKRTIVNEFGNPDTTLFTMLSSKGKLKEQYYGGEDTATRLKIRGARHDNVDKELLAWFRNMR